jgi:hypothetical protein
LASRFGSPQIIHSRTWGYFFAAAVAKFAKSFGSVGTHRAVRPPFAHVGVPVRLIVICMPSAAASSTAGASSAGQR